MAHRVRARRALLLQGPNGPFFARFGAELRARGVHVTKVNFNLADALFYRWGADDPGAHQAADEAITYRGDLPAWGAACGRLLDERQIDAVYLFGDCRPIHRAAIAEARARGVPVWVFEEGYLRPNTITLEAGGVNGHSSMPRDPAIYRAAPRTPRPTLAAVGDTIGQHAVFTVINSIAITFGRPLFPRYRHHRNVNAFYGAFCYVRGGLRKLVNRARERGVVERIVAERAGRYFVVALQVHCDSQLSHSRFPSVEAFIEEVVATFAAHAPATDALVVKHHPQDVPFRDYRALLARLADAHGLGDRLIYIHDAHLPTLLRHARGAVTINSTVGTTALQDRTPVKVMGTAVYDIPGLTFQGSLGEFFQRPGSVDGELFARFCDWLYEHNQIGGSFYKRLEAYGTPSGLSPEGLRDDDAPGAGSAPGHGRDAAS